MLGFVLASCGSKTGLEAPDADLPDATPDATVRERCVELPPETDRILVDFTLPVSLAVIDLFFLIDATASMEDEIDNVREGLTDVVVPGVRRAIPDAAFGLSFLGEFPVEPHGPRDVRPYDLRVPITQDIPRVEGALEGVPEWGNFDEPEAQVEALYQVATGEGLPGRFMDILPPSIGCPSGGTGGVCFRNDSLPVVILITDAPFHNGPDGRNAYRGIPEAHSYAEAVDALLDISVRVIGLGARDLGAESPMPDLRRVASDTGAVREDGAPLAFDIGSRGNRVGSGIVDAVERLAQGLPLDVDAVAEDVIGDRIDARELIAEIVPRSADPRDGVVAIGETRFIGVTPGTEVTFEVVIDGSAFERRSETVFVPARVQFRAFGRSRLGSEQFTIAIVGESGEGCADSEF
ncbi:MAG: hypothetical protein AAGF12_38245 [Myxococcota bacterium]